ncbi:hypothetical protein [Sabulibacter ruber]|uniref:hypothetical protein n=1 Tax=Sabulibacter ruber TaxID=2811901 RepID=UPI001A977ABA|nr:hypothetical protein [Sabulibacter ruber]
MREGMEELMQNVLYAKLMRVRALSAGRAELLMFLVLRRTVQACFGDRSGERFHLSCVEEGKKHNMG